MELLIIQLINLSLNLLIIINRVKEREMREWMITEPVFESDQINPALRTAYWEGHRDFAYDFLRFVHPKKMVELGSQYGCSLFCFCQSIKDFNLATEIHAIDRWAGDIGAVDDGETVYKLVNTIKETYYANVNLRLYQMDFDSAAHFISDNSIDVLHIDGGHRFEDVDHDFNTWLPKLKENGIILFHDVYSEIDKGSCRHWEYICKNYQTYFDFTHSCGLGILFPKGDYWYKELEQVGFFKYYKDLYYYRSRFKYTFFRFQELSDLYVKRYDAIQQQSGMIQERDQTIKDQADLLDERYKAIEDQSKMIAERDQTIKAQGKLLEERYNALKEQDRMVNERDRKIEEQNKILEANSCTIKKQEQLIENQRNDLNKDEKFIQEQKQLVDKQKQELGEKEHTLQEQLEQCERQNEKISQIESDLAELQDKYSKLSSFVNRNWLTSWLWKKAQGGTKV